MKKILFVTSARSEFGILKNIILSTSNISKLNLGYWLQELI